MAEHCCSVMIYVSEIYISTLKGVEVFFLFAQQKEQWMEK